MKRLLPLIILIGICLFPPDAPTAPEPVPAVPGPVVGPGSVLPGGSRPGGKWDGIMQRTAEQPPEQRAWSVRTGARKGITDLSLPAEIAAAPDVAVLRSGFYPEAAALLAEFREPAVIAEPDRIAGLASTKPALVIPSGGLAGLASSEFFRAGLAEYVTSGGIVICFSQQRGADLAALPVPPGPLTAVTAAGWDEDHGPLFRASRIHTPHPVLAGLVKPVPSVETDGYLTAVPSGSTVILSRSDGFPTLVLYPVGRGWIAVSMLASDVLFSQGALEQDERELVHGLVWWAKAGGIMTERIPGQLLEAVLAVPGTDRSEAAAVRIFVMEGAKERPRDERTVPITARSALASTLSFSWWVPADSAPGIHHLEYAFTDGKKRLLTSPAEAAGGWFAVMPRAFPAGEAAPALPPLAPPPAGISLAPVLRHSGAGIQLLLALSRGSGQTGPADLIIRADGQERRVTVDREPVTAQFDLAADRAARRISYSALLDNGRIVARGTVPAAAPPRPGVSLDRTTYLPGQKVGLAVNGMGLGAFSGTFFGIEQRQHISKDAVFEFAVPPSLPAGAYPLVWEFQTRAGTVNRGEVSVPVAGSSAFCSGVTVTPDTVGKRTGAMVARLAVTATDSIAATATLRIAAPDGPVITAAEKPVALRRGQQEIALPFAIQPRQAGIWQLLYELTAMPAGAAGPVVLAAGRMLIDAGDAAVLDVRTDQPIHYEPGAQRDIIAVIHARTPARADLLLDGGSPKRRKIEAAGTHTVSWPQESVSPGPHTARVTASGISEGEHARTLLFLNGARLPDLVPVIRTSELMGPAMEVGVGVVNQGRLRSGHARAMLYEGDPAAGGTLLNAVPVPPLEPGKQHVVIVPWPLGGKAGKRSLFAVVSSDDGFIETNQVNNTAAVQVNIPDMLLTLSPRKNAFPADEPAAYTMSLLNFTTAPFRAVTIHLQAADPAGRIFNPEILEIGDLASGAERRLERVLPLDAPPQGTYIISARAEAGGMAAVDSLGITILPTLRLIGSLEGTPSRAAPCGTLEVRHAARSAGNIPLAASRLSLEVRPRSGGEPVFRADLPFPRTPARTMIDRITFPRGDYTVQLRGLAVPKEGASQEFLLAEHPLAVTGPLDVDRSSAPFPRILLWAGLEGAATLDRAIAEKLIKEAFDQEDVYLKIVASGEDFAEQARTGIFTTLLLFDADGSPDPAPVLRRSLADGAGVVIVGSNDGSQSAAESLGFRFGPPRTGGSTSIAFPPGSEPGITGSLPVSGRVLAPEKQGAKAAALLPDGSRPVVLIDRQGRGKIMVVPFSLTRSALDSGMSAVYAVLLRSAVRAVNAEQAGPLGIGARQLSVASPTGPVEARITETLPDGASFIWTSSTGTVRDRTVTFEFVATAERRSLLYLYRTAGANRPVASEVRFQCGGSLVVQERTE